MDEASSRTTRRTGHLIGVATLASLAAYLACSQELRFQLQGLEYGRALVAGFVRERGWGAVRLLRPVAPSGLLVFAAWVASVALAGVALRRAAMAEPVAPRRTGALCAAVMAAIVLPPLLLATLAWPDGRGLLRSAPLVAATLVLAAVAEGAFRWRRGRIAREVSQAPRRERITPPPSVIVGEPPPERDASRAWLWLAVALVVPLALATWWNGMDSLRGFDSQSDHLPRAARWLRLGTITDESGELLTPYYPGNFLFVVRWLLVLGTDAYTFVASLAASVLCLWLLYRICRELGQPRRIALVATLSATSCTLLPYLSTTVQPDSATAACLLLAVLLLLRWAPTTDRRTRPIPVANELGMLAALGASLGLAIGIKYSSLPPALAIGAVAMRYAWRGAYERDERGAAVLNARTVLESAATIAIAAFACCGYWLVRNLVQHGNPVYPVAAAGLPGVDMRTIIPIKPALVGSLWHRATYPWVQWDYRYVYDDGVGAVFAAVATVGFLVMPFRRPATGRPARLLWVVTVGAYALWIGTGSITARFGLFPLLLTFCFVGELWREFGSPLIRVATLAAFAVSAAATVKSLVVGAVYAAVTPPERIGVPRVVDSLPPTRIFNATEAANRYRLLGADYRHEVITQFRTPVPADVTASRAEYVLLTSGEVAPFRAALPLTFVAKGGPMGGDTLSLWRVGR